jgi:class 3 adenylate cyclase
VPLYLDRHDLPGITPEELAAAHERDVAVQDEYGVTYHTYWFEPETGAVFCLAEGPTKEAVVEVHEKAHGAMASSVIELDTFAPLTEIVGAMPQHPVGTAYTASAIRAILFTDLCDSFAQIHALGDEGHLEVLRVHNSIVRAALESHSGREVKHTGDGIMAAYTSVASAVASAIEMQRGFDAHNTTAEVPLSVKIGISAGEPVTDDNDDLYGAAVGLAARLCAHATASEILTTVGVREMCLGKKMSFESRGEVALKGMPETTFAYAVLWQA